MYFKINNIFKDYLTAYINKEYKKKYTGNFIAVEEDGKKYFSDGHIMAILPSCFKTPFTLTPGTFSKIIDKYADKEVHISNMTITLNSTECYILKDDFDNDITYINKKMFDNWFDKGDVELVMKNLDNKSIVFIKGANEIIGLILPVIKR